MRKLKKAYATPGDKRLELLETAFHLIRTHYNCKPSCLVKDIGVPTINFYRYLNGTRILSEYAVNLLSSFVNRKILAAADNFNQLVA